MFNFRELLKIFKTNWKNIINEILPKDNKKVIDDGFTNNFNSGAIFCIVSVLLTGAIAVDIYAVLRLGLMIAGMILFNNYKKKEVGSTAIFVLFVLSSLGMLGSFLSAVFCIPVLIITIIVHGIGSYVFSLFTYVLNVIGYAFITVACIDFCKAAREEYENSHKVVKEEQISLKTISVNDVAMHANINCPYCKSEVSFDDLFCQTCGKKLK